MEEWQINKTKANGFLFEHENCATTYEENKFITKRCNCVSECEIQNVKWLNDMLVSVEGEQALFSLVRQEL